MPSHHQLVATCLCFGLIYGLQWKLEPWKCQITSVCDRYIRYWHKKVQRVQSWTSARWTYNCCLWQEYNHILSKVPIFTSASLGTSLILASDQVVVPGHLDQMVVPGSDSCKSHRIVSGAMLSWQLLCPLGTRPSASGWHCAAFIGKHSKCKPLYHHQQLKSCNGPCLCIL